MRTALAPSSLDELQEAVRSAPRLLAVGGGTKPRLAAVDVPKVSTSRLRGILEYDPSEFTFTALAGTPVREIADSLAQCGQYLPFDPMCVESGATLGGTVASGLSGPGRFRFGGARDFILGVRFVDGAGRLLRLGGKVVKNAAGFDVPKFFVGSLGRFGVLAEITFKVFPRPAQTLTLRLPVGEVQSALSIMAQAGCARWELDALDLLPGGKFLVMRLAGPTAALELISQEILKRWPGESLAAKEEARTWLDLLEFRWAHKEGPLLKARITPAVAPGLDQALHSLEGAQAHLSAGANVAFISLASSSQASELDKRLNELDVPAVTLRGEAPLWLGPRLQTQISNAVKKALDAEQRFPSLDD